MVRTRRIVVVSVFALALGVGALGWAQPPTGDYASGFGFWRSETPGSVGFEAIGTVDGQIPQGEFDFRKANRAGQGRGFHADVTCLEVDGNTAFIGVVVETSNDPSVAPGDQFEAYAEDNGDGRNDRFDLQPADDDNPAECDFDEDPDPISGNINVVDEGLFRRNP